MALANAAGVLLKPQTPLQQLLEDINFQRTKEMRQLLKDDSGFVVLQGTTYWTDLFVRHFLFQSEPQHSIDSDDLLFFVRKKHVKSSSRHMPKYETEVDVFRKDSRKLPIGDPDVDWEETVYLNMVIHQFDYTLTLAICTRTSPKELQVLRRHSQRVYASPSRRKMDTKGEGEEITYPHICFMVDNFDEVFSDILVRDGEMVCVELVANDKDGSVQGVIFLGSIRYDALKKVYDARQSSLSSKVAQRMSFGLFSSGAGVQTRCEFVRMKGPQGKGHAEMAVTKPKGSGVETPTSEPGFCATDMWDDWEEENDDYCTYRHQRRLSDPSANLNNFSRYGWRMKQAQDVNVGGGTAGTKARSENEGLDSLANEVSEIEAGDLRDDQQRSAFSASMIKLHTNPNCEANNAINNIKIAIENPATTATPTELDKENENSSKESVIVTAINGIHHTTATTNNKLNKIDNIITTPPNDAEIVDAIEAVASTSPTTNKTGCGGNCFGSGSKKCKRWVSSTLSNSKGTTPQMSEIYCSRCDDAGNETPACLNKMPDKTKKLKPKTLLSLESELVVTKRSTLRTLERKSGLCRSASLSAADRRKPQRIEMTSNKRETERNKIKEKEKEKEKEKNKENYKSKEKPKTIKKSSSLLAKVSPKKLRNKLTTENKTEKTITTAAASSTTTKGKTINRKIEETKSKTKTNKNQIVDNLVIVEIESNKNSDEYELADDATSLNGLELNSLTETTAKMAKLKESDTKLMISVRGCEELPEEPSVSPTPSTSAEILIQHPTTKNNKSFNFEKCVPVKSDLIHPLMLTNANSDIEEENTALPIDNSEEIVDNKESIKDENAENINETTPMLNGHENGDGNRNVNENCDNLKCKNIVENGIESENEENAQHSQSNSDENNGNNSGNATLPRTKKRSALYNRALNLVPKRHTPDGTTIYYWCDLPKKAIKELDDGAYNPLWASRGFTQSFHFWKENRRQQSTPLNAFLTYVTLPWWSIAKDLLDHRETPILTF